jgi:hypothetical protein
MGKLKDLLLEKTNFMDKYPVHSLIISKDETSFQTVDAVLEHLKALIVAHPIATFITTFDHFSHTNSIEDSVIHETIKDAKNLIFCFGKQIPSAKMLAVRPRSIGVTELEDSFSIDTLEAPNEQLHEVLVKWIHSVKNK